MAQPKKFAPRPEHAFIGNHTFQIEWLTADEWDSNKLDPDSDALTFARRNLILIRLYPDAHESHYQEVLWHEITHACWDASMLTHIKPSEHEDIEEFIIGLQSPPQVFVLKQNPEFVAWLVSDGNEAR